MRQRPILMNDEMVRAILDGRKTQTRRPVKFRDPTAIYSVHDDDGWPLSMDEWGMWVCDLCPLGEPGDRLWVRETWAEDTYCTGGMTGCSVVYRADNPVHYRGPWRPSIHMPRWASRITLEVVSVRTERVQAITEADARAEGVRPWVPGHGPIDPRTAEAGMVMSASYRDGFQWAWDRRYVMPGDGWDDNPWVWVVEFRKVEP